MVKASRSEPICRASPIHARFAYRSLALRRCVCHAQVGTDTERFLETHESEPKKTMTELQKITISTNHWRVPSAENALDGWLEGSPSESEMREARVKALAERASWMPSEEGMRLVEQLKVFIGTRVQIQFWDSGMFMCEEEGPFPLEGNCKDVLLLQQDDILQAFMVLDHLREIPTPDGYTPKSFLSTVDGIHGQLASLANVYEVWPVNPDGSVAPEIEQSRIRAVQSHNAIKRSARKLVKGLFTTAELDTMYPLWFKEIK